jgi:hypothetical protein
MGRPRKIIDGQEEIQAEGQEEAENVAPPVVDPNARVAYVKNGVTRLRYPADEKELFDQGWARK